VKAQNATLPMIEVHDGFAEVLLGNGTQRPPMEEIFDEAILRMENGYRYRT
jgi:hypothetical protein